MPATADASRGLAGGGAGTASSFWSLERELTRGVPTEASSLAGRSFTSLSPAGLELRRRAETKRTAPMKRRSRCPDIQKPNWALSSTAPVLSGARSTSAAGVVARPAASEGPMRMERIPGTGSVPWMRYPISRPSSSNLAMERANSSREDRS